MRVVPTGEIAPPLTLGPGEFLGLAAEVKGWKMPLTTDGHLRIVMMGIGSAFASRNFQTNIIIVKGDLAIFIDFGTLAAQRLRQFGLTPLDVERMILTHSHADHVGGVEEVALKWRYMKSFLAGKKPGELKPHLYCPGVYQKILWDQSLRGGLGSNEANRKLVRLTLEDYFHLHTPEPVSGMGRPAYRFKFEEGGGLDLLLFRTKHVPDTACGWQDSFWSVGMVIDNRILYTGDTRFDPEIIDHFGQNTEVIFHDCQSFPGGVHACYEEVSTLDKSIRERMLLMHLDDGMLSKKPEEEGFLGLAQDGLEVVYDFD
ncbi:MAG: MBL fold metallo-hydrolase [Planctomycetota bacterium]|jgi:ribonuclease BN (tRNA processing enzyme)